MIGSTEKDIGKYFSAGYGLNQFCFLRTSNNNVANKSYLLFSTSMVSQHSFTAYLQITLGNFTTLGCSSLCLVNGNVLPRNFLCLLKIQPDTALKYQKIFLALATFLSQSFKSLGNIYSI